MKRYREYRRKTFVTRRLEKKSRQSLLLSIVVLLIFAFLFFNWILPVFIGSLSFLNKFKSNSNNNNTVIEGETLAPPVLNIPYEATNTAKINISGYAQPNKSVEIYVDDQLVTTVATNIDGSFLGTDIDLFLGINNIYGKTSGEQQAKSLSSKTIRIIYDNKKPKLDIPSPTDGQVVKGGDKKITVSGTTDPGVTVKVNNNVLIVDSDGKFSSNIDINEGDNILSITAQDMAGNSTNIERKIKYEP